MVDLDTSSKRASSVGIMQPSAISTPWPDGTISQGDRQHAAFSYSGILASAAVTIAATTRYFRSIVTLAAYYLSVVTTAVYRNSVVSLTKDAESEV